MPTDDPDAERKRTARSYLGKSLWSLSSLTAMSPEDIAEAAEARRAGDPVDAPADLWKLALYWALGRRFFNGSPELTHDEPDGDGDELPHVPRYRDIGTAEYGDIPAFIRDEGVFLSSKGPTDYG